MKREKYAKEKALFNAEKINAIRVKNETPNSPIKKSFKKISVWTKDFRDGGVQYIYKMTSELKKLGYLKAIRDLERGFEMNFFEFSDKPIYYKDLIPIFREIYDYNQKKPSMEKERPRTFSIANHGVSITSLDENKLKGFTDAELVSELRDRGYTVTAEKVTVIKL